MSVVSTVREEFNPFMSIAHELSSDVAAAMLARRDDKTAGSARDLAEVVREVHTTLRQLTSEARRHKTRPRDAAGASCEAPATGGACSE